MGPFGDSIGNLFRKLRMLAARGLVTLTDDSRGIQVVNLRLLAKEARTLERLQNYGFTSVPLASNGDLGPEAVVLFLNGDRSQGIALVVDDRRYRLRSLAPGEVALYDDQGQVVHLKRNGEILIQATTKVTIDVPDAELTGNLAVGGNIAADGDVAATGEVTDQSGTATTLAAMRTIYNAHTHVTAGITSSPPSAPM